MIIAETECCNELSVETSGVFVFIESGADSLCVDRRQAKELAVVLADYAMTGELPE